MNERKLSHKGSRQKGKRLEHDVVKALKQIGIDAKRVPLSGALSWLKGDVVEFNTIKAHLHECKNCEGLELPAWWRQAVSQCLNGEVPVLEFTSNYQKIWAVMRIADFDDLVFGYEKYRPELTIKLVDFPQRKNFWKFILKGHDRFSVYPTTIDGEEVAVFPFDMYLLMRKWDIKRQADEALAAPAALAV